jgi:hypothetical protein
VLLFGLGGFTNQPHTTKSNNAYRYCHPDPDCNDHFNALYHLDRFSNPDFYPNPNQYSNLYTHKHCNINFNINTDTVADIHTDGNSDDCSTY